MMKLSSAVVLTAAVVVNGAPSLAEQRTEQTLDSRPDAAGVEAESRRDGNDVSPVRRIDRRHRPPRSPRPESSEYRAIDGSGNNLVEPSMGATHEELERWSFADYGDGVSTMAGDERPSARKVSNAVSAQTEDAPNPMRASDFLWQWGQFLDHDLDLTDGADPPEPAAVDVPVGDPWFDPGGEGDKTIAFNRSIYSETSGIDPGYPRQQINEITAWIDASNVYGSDVERARERCERSTARGGLKLERRRPAAIQRTATDCPNAGGIERAELLPRGRLPSQRTGRAGGDAHAVRSRAQLLGGPDPVGERPCPGRSRRGRAFRRQPAAPLPSGDARSPSTPHDRRRGLRARPLDRRSRDAGDHVPRVPPRR